MKQQPLLLALALLITLPLAFSLEPVIVGAGIDAVYGEEIQQPGVYAQTALLASPQVSQEQQTILLRELPAVYGTSTYIVLAADYEGDLSAHDVQLTTTPGFELTPPYGISNTEELTLQISQDNCEWRPAARNQGNWQEIPAEGLERLDTRFGLSDGEYLHLDIRCGDDPVTIQAGIDTQELTFVTGPQITPRKPAQNSPVTLTFETNKKATCSLNNEEKQTTHTTTHEFTYLQAGETYSYTCTDRHTTLQGSYEIPEHANPEQQTYVTSPAETTSETYVLSVETTTPSTCTANGEPLGRLREDTQHQRVFELSEHRNDFNIRCGDEHIQHQVTYTRAQDINQPTVNAYLCPGTQEVHVQASNVPENYWLELQGSYDLLRQSTGQSATFLAPGIGEQGNELTARTIHPHNQELTSSTTITIQEANPEMCAREEQTITLDQPTKQGGVHASTQDFTLQLTTDHPSTCTVQSATNEQAELTRVTNYRYELVQAASELNLPLGEQTAVTLTCTDETGVETTKQAEFWYGDMNGETITVLQPTIDQTNDFTLEVQTTNPSTCTAQSNYHGPTVLEAREDNTHRISSAANELRLEKHREQTISILCEETATGAQARKEHTLLYGFAAPEIEETRVTPPRNLQGITSLYYELDQLATCSIEGKNAQNTDKQTGTLHFQLNEEQEDITLLCENAQGRSTQQTQTIQTAFAEETPQEALPFEITQPSELAVADRPDFDFEIVADRVCEWRFHHPDTSNPWNTFSEVNELSDGSYEQRITRFRDNYPLTERTFHYLDVRCGNEERLVPVGFSETQAASDQTRPLLVPQQYVSNEDPVVLHKILFMPAMCEVGDYTVTPWTNNALHYPAQNTQLIRTQANEYSCLDAHGNDYSGGFGRYQVATEEDVTKTAFAPYHYPSTSLYQEVVAYTNHPTTCTLNHENQAYSMSSTSDGTTHYETIAKNVLGESTVDITCESGATTQAVLTRERTAPQINAQSAYLCQGNTVLDIETSEEMRLLSLQGAQPGEPAILYDERESNRYEYTGGRVGDTITIHAYTRGGAKSSATIQVQQPTEGDCTYDNRIDLVQPTNHEIQTDDEFTIRVRTEAPSTCTMNGVDMRILSDQEHDTFHELRSNDLGLMSGERNNLDVTCTNLFGTVYDNTLPLYYNLPEPEVTSVQATPQTVTEYENPFSTIQITTNTHVSCVRDDTETQPRAVYNTENELEHQATQGVNNVTFICQNPHEELTSGWVLVQGDYPSLLSITNPEPEINQTTATIYAHTNIPSECTAQIYEQGASQAHATREMSATDGFSLHHEATFTDLPQGVYRADTTCEERESNIEEAEADVSPQRLQPQTLELTQPIIIDITPPSINITSSQFTCGLDRYLFEAEVTNDVPGNLEEVIIELQGQNYTRTISRSQVTERITALNFGEDQRYTVRAWARDGSGNLGGPASAEFEAASRSSPSCDQEAPRAELNRVNQTSQGNNYNIYCEDNVACRDTYELAVVSSEASCGTLEQREFLDTGEDKTMRVGDTFFVEEDSRVCFKVSDYAGNTYEDEWPVTIEAFDEETDEQTNLCADGEISGQQTDVDCGGILCEKCEVNQACETDRDCQSNSCQQGVCAEATCSDGRQSGDQTGIDCGGSCEEGCFVGESCNVDSDCASGICSSRGECVEEELANEGYQAPEEQTPATQEPEESSSLPGIILILLGALTALGGGGYWYYEQTSHPANTSTKARPDSLQGAREQPRAQQPAINLNESKLRTEARKEKQTQRKENREELLQNFEEDPENKK